MSIRIELKSPEASSPRGEQEEDRGPFPNHHAFASRSVGNLKDADMYFCAEQHQGDPTSKEVNGAAIASLNKRRAVLAAESMDRREEYQKGDPQYQTALDFYRLEDDVTDWRVTGWDQVGRRDRMIKEEELRDLSESVDRDLEYTCGELRNLQNHPSKKNRQLSKSLFNFLKRHIRWLSANKEKLTATIEQIQTGDADFPARTESMIDNIRRLASWPRRTGPKVFMAGLNHLRTATWRERDPRFNLAPLYEEMGQHKSVLLVPKVFDEHLSDPSNIGNCPESFGSAERN